MPLPKFLAKSSQFRAININPHGVLNHDDQDHQRLANAVLQQAVRDLTSNDPDIYGPAWDFLTGATEDDVIIRHFWAANARMDIRVLEEWAERHETRKVQEWKTKKAEKKATEA